MPLADAAISLSSRTDGSLDERVAMLSTGLGSLFSYSFLPISEARSMAVVICPSFFESKTLLPAEIGFARAAAGRGFPVIYVQPPGSGESEGDPSDCSISARLSAAEVGIETIGAMSGCSSFCLMGARLGGAVAIAAGASGSHEAVAVWDPVLTGSDYLKQAVRLDRIASLAGGRKRVGGIEEQIRSRGWATLLGNVVTRPLFEELDGLELPREGRIRRGFASVLNEPARQRILSSAFAELVTHRKVTVIGRRDLGHLGFSIDDAQRSIDPTLDWLSEGTST